MKCKYINLDRRKSFNLASVLSISDKWGIPWQVSSFRVDGIAGCGGYAYIKFYGENGLPYVTTRKKLNYIPTQETSGPLQIKIDRKIYSIGSWEIKDI